MVVCWSWLLQPAIKHDHLCACLPGQCRAALRSSAARRNRVAPQQQSQQAVELQRATCCQTVHPPPGALPRCSYLRGGALERLQAHHRRSNMHAELLPLLLFL